MTQPPEGQRWSGRVVIQTDEGTMTIPRVRSADMHVSGRWLFIRHDEPDTEESWYHLGDDVVFAEWQPEYELRNETEAERAERESLIAAIGGILGPDRHRARLPSFVTPHPSTPSAQAGPVE
jgi:hypothetical protein